MQENMNKPFLLSFFLLWIVFIFPLSKINGQDIEFPPNFNATLNFILDETDPERIASFLRNMTLRPHEAGTEAERETADFVSQTWKNQGLDEVHLASYDVLLSYPQQDKPNYIRIHNSDSEEVWISQGRTKPLYADEEFSDEVFPDFNAYSATGNVSGDIIYANYGQESDFQRLEDELGVSVSGRIVLARYGATFRANIVKSAEDRGAAGVILYPDPQQYAQEGSERVYPHTVYMPGSAAPFGTAFVDDGDPLTPFYPSIESAYRIPENETTLPKIPVTPIGYDDAQVILSQMGGDNAPLSWQGALNLTYKLGPGFEEPSNFISMEVNTHNQKTKIYNVIGVIKGSEEPDRYVVLGNHRDAWIFGAIDPTSGTATMLELSRILTEYRRTTGWSPKRSLIFCSWGAEEFGLVGSQEWGEQFGKQLSDRSIAYLNIDMSIEGNYTLRTKATPLLYTASREMAKLVPNPDPLEVLAGRATVYDTWVYRNPEEDRPDLPRFTGLGSGSDYKCFQHNLGIPSMDYRYTHSREMFAEPLYHTLYETFYLTSELYDRGFHFHASIAQIWGLLGVFLADSAVLPFSLDEYALFIDDAQQSLFEDYGDLVAARNISLEYFRNASLKFSETAGNFQTILDSLDQSNALAVRRINDQLMMVERSFIDPHGLPGRPNYNHVIFAPSSYDSYASTAFAGLSDALQGIEDLPPEEQEAHWRTFQEHLAVCTHLLETASRVLSDDLWFSA